jgi:hypothetical protein
MIAWAMTKLPLLWKCRKLVGYSLAALALAVAIWAAIDSYGDRRARESEDSIQALWDADEDEEKRVADEATRAAELQDAADAARNEEIARDYQAKIAAATADRDRTFRLLQRARAAASAVPATEAPSAAGVADPGPPSGAGEAGSTAEYAAQLDAAIADVVAEARANAAQLDALRMVVIPQM